MSEWISMNDGQSHWVFADPKRRVVYTACGKLVVNPRPNQNDFPKCLNCVREKKGDG